MLGHRAANPCLWISASSGAHWYCNLTSYIQQALDLVIGNHFSKVFFLVSACCMMITQALGASGSGDTVECGGCAATLTKPSKTSAVLVQKRHLSCGTVHEAHRRGWLGMTSASPPWWCPSGKRVQQQKGSTAQCHSGISQVLGCKGSMESGPQRPYALLYSVQVQ